MLLKFSIEATNEYFFRNISAIGDLVDILSITEFSKTSVLAVLLQKKL